MTGARDRYERTPAAELAAMQAREWIRREMQQFFALRLTVECCYDAFANVPGTLSNTLLLAFVATDPSDADAPDAIRHRLPNTPQYVVLRQQAWRALSGEYQRALLDG